MIHVLPILLVVTLAAATVPAPVAPAVSVLAAPGGVACGQGNPATATVGYIPDSAAAPIYVAIEHATSRCCRPAWGG